MLRTLEIPVITFITFIAFIAFIEAKIDWKTSLAREWEDIGRQEKSPIVNRTDCEGFSPSDMSKDNKEASNN